jgi:hypothetical protein
MRLNGQSREVIMTYCVLRKVHSLFQDKFFTNFDSALPLSVSSIFFFHWGHSSCLRLRSCFPVPYILPSVTLFRRWFLREMWKEKTFIVPSGNQSTICRPSKSQPSRNLVTVTNEHAVVLFLQIWIYNSHRCFCLHFWTVRRYAPGARLIHCTVVFWIQSGSNSLGWLMKSKD